MLLLKPNCEFCNKDLPPDSTEARICSYECTFCADCVDEILENVCPNCGGGLCHRPIRPKTNMREGIGLQQQPASKDRVKTSYSEAEIREFSKQFKNVPAQYR